MIREHYFSTDYITARQRFRDAVAASGARLDSLKLAATGPQGEDLTIDVAWFGPEKPRRVFVHSSGLHGVEAFAGSAIQLNWLHEGLQRNPSDGAIVLVHVLNPYGMAWLRRFSENNVDLNRNFYNPDDHPAPKPSHWQEVDAFLNPPTPPAGNNFYFHAACLAQRYGMRSLKRAIAGGQRLNPKGLFFSGHKIEEGPAKYQTYLEEHFANAERIVAVDVRTGLGRFGDDRLLADSAAERFDVNQSMCQAYGERFQLLGSDGIAYPVRGAQHDRYYRLFPKAKIYFATQEFGTYHSMRIVKVLREENRWHHYGAGTVDHPTKTRLRKAFNPDGARWRRLILKRGVEVINQGLKLAFEREGDGLGKKESNASNFT
jgi:hypothetical protein